ncbi:RNase P modulator RnpM [Fructilactobacillus fructivorans]|uniref:Putative nucleic-acid-binding protein implicated in transcription termination n=1 Tax=Fructilactobacillus fructivorans TaxID=1614 RepID=A0A0C1M0L6_9LACO|nr:YlxR family protein [Fructilactobacillus fructivorans]KID42660.1 putative nucleic-acid-binding protein implicated in transcription termination [Fructilactobacillus fructivorans]MCT0151886.1 YlxR family protein [Fructilactobacillus fructivorans]MCT2867985.1 YlxR family protein [Fructilactobacillus fructivorans]MCT2868637.1 YlxR family protein [Fructilactobacillus fructivorans]MCT2873432.1 YlxR family protein [Fructilactobacillus fructivorans]
MRKRKVPMRKDVVSGEMAPKRQLVRIVRDKEGNVSVDPTGKQSGRGAYVKIDVETAKKAKQDKILDQVFEVTLTDDFYDKLIDYVDHKQARQELIDNDKL